MIATALDEESLEGRFDGRGWEQLEAEEKVGLLQEIEKATASIEDRKFSMIELASKAELKGDEGRFRDGDNTIQLREDLLAKGGESKRYVLRLYLHERQHARQRDMVMWDLAEKARREHRGPEMPDRYKGEMQPAQKEELLENYKPENRIAPGPDPEERLAYQSQPVEVDAEMRAREMLQRIERTAMRDEKNELRPWR